MFKLKKILALVMIMILTFSLAACSGSSKTSSGNAGTKVDKNGKIDTSKPVTVTMMVLGDKPTNGQVEKVLEKVNAKLKEKVNATIQLKWIEWADYTTKYNLTLASGEPVDLVITAT